MKNNFFPYQMLALLLILFMTAAWLARHYWLRPRQQHVQEIEQLIRSKTRQIADREWPVDPEQLSRLRQQKRVRLELLLNHFEASRELAINTFADAIQERFGVEAVEDPIQFMNYVTRLDYQEYYSRIIGKWQDRGVLLHPQVLQLHEDSVSPRIYRLILQLWTVDAVLTTLAESGLTPVITGIELPLEEGRPADSKPAMTGASKVALQPIQEYRRNLTATQGFLVELPVRVVVNGSTSQFMDLLDQLADHRQGWLPINAVEIRKQPLIRKDTADDKLEIMIEFSAFYPLQHETEIELESKGEAVPRGV